MARTRERRAHKPLTAAGLKKREDQKGGLYDSLAKEGIPTWRPKHPGQHTVRFLEGTWPDAEHWAHDTWIHNNIGPDSGRYLCLKKMLGKPCALCEEVTALRNVDEEKAYKDIQVRKGAAAWLIDRNAEDEGPQLWFYGRTTDEEFASRCRNRKTGEPIDIIDPDEGHDFFFKTVKEGKEARNVKYGGYELDRDPTPIHEKQKVQDKWLDFVEENPVPDCFQYFDYDYLKALITGSRLSKSADDDDEDDEDERPSRGKRRSIDDDDDDDQPKKRRGRARDDDNDEEDDDPPPRNKRRVAPRDEEDDDDEPVSKRRRQRDDDDGDDDTPPRKRRARDDDDEDDDPPPRRTKRASVDDDEDEPRSRRASKGRSRDDEDEDEDEPPSRRKTRVKDDDADDDEPPPKKRKRARLEEDDDDAGEEVVAQAKRSLKRLKDEAEDEDDDPPPRKKRRGL